MSWHGSNDGKATRYGFMTPHRSNGRGTFLLEKQWQGVRISRASGTNDPQLHAKLVAMLEELKRTAEWDLRAKAFRVWQALASGQLHPLGVYRAWRLDGLRGLPDPDQLDLLRPKMERWITQATTREGKPLAAKTKKSYDDALHRITTETSTLQDLPKLLRARRGMVPVGTFNMERTAALSFVRNTLGKHHPLWIAVDAIEPQQAVRELREGYSPDEARRIARELGQDGIYWWSICCTGMRGPSEYFANRWDVGRDRIPIHGTKTKAAERFVPKTMTPIRCPHHYQTERERFQAVGVTAHLGRYSFRHWMQEAGIPPARADFYFGHSLSGLKMYGRHEFGEYLARDTARLIEVIGSGPQHLAVMA